MTNPFRDKYKRANYDGVLRLYAMRHRDLFRPDGSRNTGSFYRDFWKGYDGALDHLNWDRASKDMLAYVYYRAGKNTAQDENS